MPVDKSTPNNSQVCKLNALRKNVGDDLVGVSRSVR